LLVPLAAVGIVGCTALEKNDQDFTAGVRNEAEAAEAIGDYETATVHYRKLLTLRPDDGPVILSLSRNLRRTNTPIEAISILSIAKGTKEDAPEFVIELSKAEIAAGKSASALARLSILSTKHPNNWDLHATMGVAYDMVESYGQAWQAYLKALQLSSNNPAVVNNMALSAASAGRLENAISILEKSDVSVRNIPKIRQNLALLYGVRGDLDKAEALSRMDLEDKAVRNNMKIYSSLGGNIPVDVLKKP